MRLVIAASVTLGAFLAGVLCAAWVCATSQHGRTEGGSSCEQRRQGHSGIVCIEPGCDNDSGTGNLYCPDHGGDPYDADAMCPNCVTPWKCNGPHVPPLQPLDLDGLPFCPSGYAQRTEQPSPADSPAVPPQSLRLEWSPCLGWHAPLVPATGGNAPDAAREAGVL